MQNILLDRPPETVCIGGTEYPIKTDFRAGVAFELAVQQGEKRLFELLRIWYGDNIPMDIDGATDAALRFYRCGTEKDTAEEEKPATGQRKPEKQAYSFEVDADAIVSSFWMAYGIDLSTASLHWWLFRHLLFGLPEDTEFQKRVYIRTVDTKDMSRKQKQSIERQRKRLAIKHGSNMTLEERNRRMVDYVNKRMSEATKG